MCEKKIWRLAVNAMSGEDGYWQWRDLENQARDEAARFPLDVEGTRRVEEAIAQARRVLGGDNVRSHAVRFDPAKWQLDRDSVSDRLISAGQISRDDLFDLTSRLPGPATWPLFCCTYIWGQGRIGYGRTRFDRITWATSRNRIVNTVQESLARQGACGPLSAYAYLRRTGRSCTIPYWGPAFLTKLLYFADAARSHGALILDQVLACEVADLTGMLHLVDSRSRAERWTGYRYGVYLAWMAQTAAEFQVPADFLEYALFKPWER
jgi:hypothetical protein